MYLTVYSMLVNKKKTKQLKTVEILFLNVIIGGNIHTQVVAKNVEGPLTVWG